jgi:Skp family chaperone for outer membrane proteins
MGAAMKCLGLLLMTIHLLLLPVAGETRFAVIKFRDVMDGLESFKAASKRMEASMEGINKDQRFLQMQQTKAELDEVLKQIGKLPQETAQAARVELATKAESLRKELEALQRDFARFEADSSLRIRREFLESLKPIQNRIREAATKVVEERGFDCLFEVQGNSNTSLPVMVYVKNPTDITGDVLAALKAEEPPAPGEPAAAGTPAPAKPATPKPAPGKPAANP